MDLIKKFFTSDCHASTCLCDALIFNIVSKKKRVHCHFVHLLSNIQTSSEDIRFKILLWSYYEGPAVSESPRVKVRLLRGSITKKQISIVQLLNLHIYDDRSRVKLA